MQALRRLRWASAGARALHSFKSRTQLHYLAQLCAPSAASALISCARDPRPTLPARSTAPGDRRRSSSSSTLVPPTRPRANGCRRLPPVAWVRQLFAGCRLPRLVQVSPTLNALVLCAPCMRVRRPSVSAPVTLTDLPDLVLERLVTCADGDNATQLALSLTCKRLRDEVKRHHAHKVVAVEVPFAAETQLRKAVKRLRKAVRRTTNVKLVMEKRSGFSRSREWDDGDLAPWTEMEPAITELLARATAELRRPLTAIKWVHMTVSDDAAAGLRALPCSAMLGMCPRLAARACVCARGIFIGMGHGAEPSYRVHQMLRSAKAREYSMCASKAHVARVCAPARLCLALAGAGDGGGAA